MLFSDYRFTLDLHKTQSQISIPVTLGDTARKLYISFSVKGVPYVIKDGCRAVFSAKKADGTTLFNDCIIEDNMTVRYDFTANTATAEGITDCRILLYGANGRLLATPRFIMVVDKKVVYDDEIAVSDSERISIDNMMLAETARVNAEAERVASEMARTTAENDRVSAESVRAEAESQRLSEEKDRQTSEKERIAAETARVSTEKTRVDNETTRVSAENQRNSNEQTRTASETGRIDAEKKRVSAEDLRIESETTRVQSEALRKSAEILRNQNESKRESNETERISAEAERVNNEKTRVDNEKARVDNENVRIENEGARKALHEEMKTFFDGVENVLTNKNVAQELGDSEEKVISQEAASENFAPISLVDKRNLFINAEMHEGYYGNNHNENESNQSYVYFVIPVEEGVAYQCSCNIRYISKDGAILAENIVANTPYTPDFTGKLFVTVDRRHINAWRFYKVEEGINAEEIGIYTCPTFNPEMYANELNGDKRKIVTPNLLENAFENIIAKDGVGQVTRLNTEFFVGGKNLFNKNAVVSGYVNSYGGDVREHETYTASEFISINAADTLYCNGYLGSHNAFYDINRRYISGVAFGGNSTSVVVPENAAFVRITVTRNYLDKVMLSTSPINGYEPYTPPKIQPSDVEGLEGVTEEVSELKVKNLINPNTLTEGVYITAAGIVNEHTAYSLTDYIPIGVGEVLSLYNTSLEETNIRCFAAFNANKEVIRELGNDSPAKSITQSGDMAYVRITIHTEYVGSLMLAKAKPDRFLAYGEDFVINPKYISYPDNTVINAYIPDELWVAQGRTVEIYNRQVCLQHDKFHIRWNGKIGSARKRKVTINGNVAIGDYSLTLEIYDDKMYKHYSKTMTVHVVDGTLTNSHKICPIGDSLTNGKYWLPEVMNLSGEKIIYVGTYSFSREDADGNTRTGGHEGRSGFASRDYIEGNPYTFGAAKPEEAEHNLFWDSANSRFNWAKYKTDNNISADAVQIYLGSNELREDNTENVGYIKQMVDYILQDEPNIPIFVINPINRATQDGLGANVSADGFAGLSGMWDYQERYKIMDLTQRLDNAFKDYSNVHMVNLAITHDDEYNFGAQETPVNPRASQKEYLPVDGIHPQVQGYFQMADVMYSVYCAFLD